MRFRARFFALITTYAKRFVDQEDVSRLAEALLYQEADDVAGIGLLRHTDVSFDVLLDAILNLTP